MATKSAFLTSYLAGSPEVPSAQRSLIDAIVSPTVLCIAMLAVAAVTCGLVHVDMTRLFVPYVSVSAGATVACLLVSIFCWVAVMARHRAEAPLRTVVRKIRSRALLLLLPAILLPVFLAGFTAAKTAIPFLVGFGWDGFWTEADRLIFRDDVWRIAQALLGLEWMPLYAWFYTVVWGGTFLAATAFVAINAKAVRVGIFYTAMLLTWIFGGWLAALSFSAAGPAFTDLFDPALGKHFTGLHQAIAAGLPADSSLRLTQGYLAASVNWHVAVKGGGISAMPSMHLGAASIYVLAARRTRWLIPAVLFWVTIFLLSGYFGYHYWVDGIAAAGIAWLCWRTSERYFAWREGNSARPADARSPGRGSFGN